VVLLKRLHSLTIRSFLPPFFVTLFVSVFLFFLVQIVITYLDDLLGKGLRTVDLITLFVYAWIAIIPQCIPLAVLLAAIMSFGNLAENYELAAMKSSGLSLFRIMKALFVVIVILAALTFLFNNYILPVVHLKSTSLLYDIRQKKPAVNIKEGIFYSGIDNYGLLVGRKSKNKDTLRDIYIYDHSARMGNTIQMYAKSGKLTTTADTSALIMILRDGNRYESMSPSNGDPHNRALSHLNFKQLEVNIPLEDFKLKRTNEELFKGNEEMLNIWQLDSVADSTRHVISRKSASFISLTSTSFYTRTMLSLKNPGLRRTPIRQFYDSLRNDQYNSAIENALNIARNVAGNIDGLHMAVKNESDALIRYLIEWHKKIVISFVCIVLFFVGAPLGAIIRKGGLGLPVIISVLFFLAYYILTEMYMQLALERKMEPWLAMWMPLFIFLPISVFLTSRAANDSVIFDTTFYYNWIGKLFRRKKVA
jgi:lipopolysaccharide export system permease protein